MAALTDLLRRGVRPDHPIGMLLAERKRLYTTDLGGVENLSALELGLVDRLSKLDLFEALLDARLIHPETGKARKLSMARLQALGHLRVRLGDSYARMAQALGLKRRERDVPTLDQIRAQFTRKDRAPSGEPVTSDPAPES